MLPDDISEFRVLVEIELVKVSYLHQLLCVSERDDILANVHESVGA